MSELATPSTSEILHEPSLKDKAYLGEGNDVEGPVISAAPISTPIASPTEVNDVASRKNSETVSVDARVNDDATMKDMDDDLDNDLFGDPDEPMKPIESLKVEKDSVKPLTPPVDDQKSDIKPEDSVKADASTLPPVLTQAESATSVPIDTQKHSRSSTPIENEHPAKRFKLEDASVVLSPTTQKPTVPKRSPIASTPKQSSASAAPHQGGLVKHQIKFALASLRAVKRLRDAGPFLAPVDIVALNIPNYFDYIKNPMDLGTMERKVSSNMYNSISEFTADMDLIVSNCALFNGAESEISNMARNIKSSFDKHMKNMPSGDPAPAPAAKPKRKSLPVTATPKTSRMPAIHSVNDQSATPKPSHLSTITAPHSAPPKPTKPTSSAESKPFALQPSGMPTIRRDSSVDGRPKREIHPPRPKDLPYGDVKPRRKKFAAQLKFCGTVLKELMSKKHEGFSFPFLQPVDPVALNCPDYFKIIKEPMDLSTVAKKYNSNQYENADEFESDVRLMFRNCYKFNPEGSPVNMMGHRLEAIFDKKWTEKPAPAPTPPPPENGDSEFDDDSEYDSDDQLELMSNPAIKVLENQLRLMQTELNRLKKEALNEARERRRKEKQKKTGAKKPKSSEGNRRKSAPARRGSGTSQNGPIEVTYEMKKDLSEAIGNLSEKKMAQVLTMIQESVPQLRNTDQDEIELDMDLIDNGTLLKLYNFAVRKEESKPSRNNAGARSNGDGLGTAGSPGATSTSSARNKKKSKPLSEAEQTRQIEQLQKKIEQFDRVESGSMAPAETGINVSSSDEDDDDNGSSDDSSSEEE